MKKIALLAALILLNACSSSEPAPDASKALPLPEDSAASAAPASEGNLSSDPFVADQASSAPTATPPASSATAAESKAADSLLATPVPPDSSAKPSSEAASPPSTPPSDLPPAQAERAPVPKLSQNHEVPSTPVMPAAKTDPRKRNSYEEYKDYEKREASRRELQDAYDDRSLFPHEGGSWQVGLDYARNPFPNLDFDPSPAVKTFDSIGGVFSLGFFPLHSLSYGRLGIAANYAVYWTKYVLTTTSPTTTESNKVHSIDSYGAKAIYEFDYFLGQLFVPFAYYGMDKVTVRPYNLSTTNGVTGIVTVHAAYPKHSFTRTSIGGGVNFNLNRLEPTSASRGLANLGIRKTYLTYTYLADNGGTGAGHFLGLRFEY